MCVRMTCLELVFICAQGVLCVNILSWLDDVAARRFDNDPSAVVRFLIDAANAQSKVRAVFVCMFKMNIYVHTYICIHMYVYVYMYI